MPSGRTSARPTLSTAQYACVLGRMSLHVHRTDSNGEESLLFDCGAKRYCVICTFWTTALAPLFWRRFRARTTLRSFTVLSTLTVMKPVHGLIPHWVTAYYAAMRCASDAPTCPRDPKPGPRWFAPTHTVVETASRRIDRLVHPEGITSTPLSSTSLFTAAGRFPRLANLNHQAIPCMAHASSAAATTAKYSGKAPNC